MFRAIGVLIVLWGLSLHFGSTMKAFDRAATASFNTIETAAILTEYRLQTIEQ
ncbi:MAG: hypothetical protein R3B69_00580 [Candidatus Paceibacterota bacterium]